MWATLLRQLTRGSHVAAHAYAPELPVAPAVRVVRQTHVGEAAEIGSAAVILRILKEQGPCSKHHIWEKAEEAGVKSMRHVKMMLQWLKKNEQVTVKAIPKSQEAKERDELLCAPLKRSKKKGLTPPSKTKEFVFCIKD